MMLVACCECRKFVPDAVGDGQGLGECAEFSGYLAKNPSEGQQRRALVKLGNRNGVPLFWGGRLKDRRCERFKPIEEPL